jgi:Holliday junction resolvase
MRVGQSRRRDSIEPEIVKALEAVGWEVTRISGKGAPDILVRKGAGSLAYGFEIKSGSGKRTEAQEATQWPVIRSVSEALEAVGVR